MNYRKVLGMLILAGMLSTGTGVFAEEMEVVQVEETAVTAEASEQITYESEEILEEFIGNSEEAADSSRISIEMPEEPIEPTEEPASTSEEPTEPDEEPAVISEEPTEPSEEPAVISEETIEPTEEPEAVSEEPIEPAEEPEATSEEPIEPTEEPEATSEEPIEPVEEPEAASEEPNESSEEMVEIPEEPDATYEVLIEVPEKSPELAESSESTESSEFTELTEELTETSEESEIPVVQDAESSSIIHSLYGAKYFILDALGNEIDVFWGEDRQGYFFLTNQVSLADIVVHYESQLMDVIDGLWDAASQTISGDYTEMESMTIHDEEGWRSLFFMQSELPSMYISLNDVTLEEVQQDKDIKYGGNEISISESVDDSIQYEEVEIKGRGNTSWTLYDKKSYQIKFDKRTSILGMDGAKKWVLLSNASDPTMLKNALAFDLAAELGMEFVSDYVFTDLWVDGVYQGTYMVTEKVEVDKNRLDLTDEGVLVEMDQEYYEEEYYETDTWGRHLAMKDPDDEEGIPAFENFMGKLNELETALDNEEDWSVITSLLDVESAAQFYLVNEFFQNAEAHHTSQYWYIRDEGDVLHMGPVWDFDTCAESYLERYGVEGYFLYNDKVLNKLLKNPEFVELVTGLYEENYASAFSEIPSDLQEKYEQIASSAEMNYLVNPQLGKEDIKGYTFHDTYEECVEALQSWIQLRLELFDLEEVTGQEETTVYGGVDYARVYDYDYYILNNPDVYAAFGDDPEQVLQHFVIYGMKEGRSGRSSFSVLSYKNLYADLRSELLNDLELYYYHFIQWGWSEGRHTTGQEDERVGDITTLRGVDYSAVYNYIDYAWYNEDVAARTGDDDIARLVDFVEYGMKIGLQAIIRFDPISYFCEYEDLRNAFGDSIEQYYHHYRIFGISEGRHGRGCQTYQGSLEYEGIDYSSVFDFRYYLVNNQDLREALGFSAERMLQHFIIFGIQEQRQAIQTFHVGIYSQRYADLQQAFGENLLEYVKHYLFFGKEEGRIAV